jgi:hypothetical protein
LGHGFIDSRETNLQIELLVFGDILFSRLRDFLIYFSLFFAASCVGLQFEALLPDIAINPWVSSLLVFLGTKVFPVLSLFTFAHILFLLVKTVLCQEEYEELGDDLIPE